MTQTISSNKFCPALNLFLFTLRKNLGFTAIATILTLIISPFYLVSKFSEWAENNTYGIDFLDPFAITSIIIAVGVCCYFGILLYINFGFLFSKVSADAYNSMPISRLELMISRFSASFVSALIPLVAGYIGFFIAANMPLVEADFGQIWQCLGFTILMMLLCGTFVFLFVVAGGTIFDSLVSLAAASVGIPLIAIIILAMCEENLYGSVAVDYTLVKYVSPFAFALIKYVSFLSNETNTLFDWQTVLAVVTITVLAYVLCSWLFVRRKTESAGNAFAWKFAPFLIGFVIAIVCYFIFGAIFADNRFEISFWVPGGLGIVVGAVLYNIVTNRGFKKIKQAVAVILVSVLGVAAINSAIYFDAFGFENYIPENSKIENIEIGYRGMKIEVKNNDLITDLHKKIILEKPDYSDNYGNEYISITYNLNNGSEVQRQYFIPYSFAKAEKTKIVSNEVARQIKKEFYALSDLNGKFESFEISGRLENDKHYEVYLKKEEAAALINAYVADLESVDSNRLFDEDYQNFRSVHLYVSTVVESKNENNLKSFSFEFKKCSFYTNFLEELSKINIEERNTSTISDTKY